MSYSIESRYQIYVKGNEFLSFDKNMSNKYSRKLLNKSVTDAIKTASKRAFQKNSRSNS